jgi:predicted Rossmann-fold nucleotide-binding protein
MSIHNIAIFCASASGADPAYQKAADDLGRALAANKIGIIYGGAKVVSCAPSRSRR